MLVGSLTMALWRRKPASGLLHHSDRGVQYAAGEYQRILADNGLVCSMSRKGNCWDNAVVESFFSSFKAEAIPDRPWADRAAAAAAIDEYVDFYNQRRLHSTLGYRSPRAFERETVTAT